jgi:FkbM family methyltransferase
MSRISPVQPREGPKVEPDSSASRLQLIKTLLGFDLLLDPNDYFSRLLIAHGIFEAPESELVSRLVRQGDTCLDAGSHVGYYTCLLARLVGETGRVYAFDANPQACETANRNLVINGLTWAEVIHTALSDHEGILPFHISSDEQTGLSSVGSIPNSKQTIQVHCGRLETFLHNRGIQRIRLLKMDVEGSEEIVLRGLGHLLTSHSTDFILVELYDERLEVMNTCTEKVREILQGADYRAWTYENSSGWRLASEVQSRGDCNYLFVSPAIQEPVPPFSLAPVLAQTQAAQLRERETLQAREQEIHALRQATQRLQEETLELQKRLLLVENSVVWHALNVCRKMRNALAPDNTLRGRLYDFFTSRLHH